MAQTTHKKVTLEGAPKWFTDANGGSNVVDLGVVEDDPNIWRPALKAKREAIERDVWMKPTEPPARVDKLEGGSSVKPPATQSLEKHGGMSVEPDAPVTQSAGRPDIDPGVLKELTGEAERERLVKAIAARKSEERKWASEQVVETDTIYKGGTIDRAASALLGMTPRKKLVKTLSDLKISAQKDHGRVVTDEQEKATLDAYDGYVESGYIDSATGKANTELWLETVAGKLGAKGMRKYASPLGEMLKDHLKTRSVLEREAIQGYEDTVGKRAKAALDAEGLGQVAEVFKNGAVGFMDTWKGLAALAEWDTDDKKKLLNDAHIEHIRKNEKSRPRLSAELAMIDREANTELAASIGISAAHGFSEMFNDPKKAFVGDPFGMVTNAIALARLAAAGKLLVPAGRARDLADAASKFLAVADNQATGIPAAIALLKKGGSLTGLAMNAAAKVARKVPGAATAGRLFRNPSRIELAVGRASQQSNELGIHVKNIDKRVDSLIEEGMSEVDAITVSLKEAPTEAAIHYADALLEDMGISGPASKIEIADPQSAVIAYLNGDAKALKELIPEEALEAAGVKPTFTPKGMGPARKRKGKRRTKTVELDSTIVAKQFDDQLSRMPESEVTRIQKEIERIRTRMRSGSLKQMEYPFARPEPHLSPDSPGIQIKYDGNKNVDNQALLVAMAKEADGRPMPVTVFADEASFFNGPLVGPVDIINKIPIEWRTRPKSYSYKGTSKAPDMLDDFNNGISRDFALYLRRAENIPRGDTAVFMALKEAFLKRTGLTAAQFDKTRIGGLGVRADNLVDELIVRRNALTPGAPSGIPASAGIATPFPEVGRFGADLTEPGGLALNPELTQRMKESVKGSSEEVARRIEMHRERMAASRQMPVDDSPDVPIGPPESTASAPAAVRELESTPVSKDIEDSVARAEEGGPGAAEQFARSSSEEGIEDRHRETQEDTKRTRSVR